MRIVGVSPDRQPALQAYLAAQKGTTVFHTRAWSDVLQWSFDFVDRSLLLVQGGEVRGFLPLFLIRHPLLGKKAISIPLDGCYGGVMAESPGAAEAVVHAAATLVRDEGVRFIEFRTMQRQEWLRDLGFAEGAAMTYSVVPIYDRETNWKRMDEPARRAVRKARREGVVVRESSRLEDLEAVHGLLARSFRAFGSPVWSFTYLRHMRERLGPKIFRLLLAEHDGRTIGGIILLISSDLAIYKYGACDLDAYSLRPFNLLLWRAIEIASEEGCSVLNTGSHNPRDAGLLRFKRTLGGVDGPDFFYRLSADGHRPDYAKYFDGYRLVKTVWRRLPLPLTVALGARITRWMC